MAETLLTNPIPETELPLRYEKTGFVDSKFVEISTNDMIDVQMKYPLLGMNSAEEKCLLRKEAYEMLLTAAEKLPKGYRLRVWDAWRPFALQDELFEEYSVDIIRDFDLGNCSKEQQNAVICRFVSDPVEDRNLPPVHTTGGAVDVTLVDKEGRELDMGTGFDAFSDKTYTAYFESEKDKEIRNNRRLLYNVMVSAGFTNLPSEWWHFDYGDRFWAFYTKQPAIYKGVFTREEMHGDK